MNHRNKKILFAQQFMSHVWQDKEYREVGGFLSPQLIVQSPLRTCVGSENLSDTFSLWFRAFPDLNYKETDIQINDDWASIDWTVEGNHLGEFFGVSATGRKIRYSGTTTILMTDDMIHSYRADVSLSPLIEQISDSPLSRLELNRNSDDMFAHFNRITGVRLSQRQIECLALICLGNSHKAISARLGIQYSTFRTHTERALTALGLSSAKDVFDWACATRILELLVHIGLNRINTVSIPNLSEGA